MQGLVLTPEAQDFLVSTQIESGLKVAVGDPKADAMVGPEVTKAQIALKEGSKKVMALASDPTRTEVQRHEAARKVATDVEAAVNAARVAIETRANELLKSALAEADVAFGPKLSRAAIESELRGWVRDQNKKSEGIDHIRKAMLEDPEMAAVIYHSPRYLLGFSHTMHDRLKMEAVQKHQPAIYAKMGASLGLEQMAQRCKATARRVHGAFYSPALADQAKRRVDIP